VDAIKAALRRLKDRWWPSVYLGADGLRLYYRSPDLCVLDEVYRHDVYRLDGIKPGETVVDAGAHIGAFSVAAARRVGPKGRVFAFEPSPRSRALLERNLRANRLSWAKVHPWALAEAEGEAPLFVAEGAVNPVADTLRAQEGRSRVAVRLRRLDDVLAEEGVERVDHLKIDVEGSELRVLDGASRALSVTRRLVMEIHPQAVEPEEVRERLEALGFSCDVRPQGAGFLLEAARR
jgi:FkbM family methyltransferase